MQDRQWSRSRYWLCHFLHNRHERVRIAWDAPAGGSIGSADSTGSASDPLPIATARWLAWISQTNAPARQRLIDWAVTDCASDPAYVQSIRLFVKEEQHHTLLIERYLALRGQPMQRAGWGRAAVRACIRPLGLRFELSILLLSEIAVITMNRLLLAQAEDQTLRGLLTQLIHDHQCHLAFHCERLTAEFADFNFIRRNLRRLRLRAMFITAFKGMTLHHAALLQMTGCSPRDFARNCHAHFNSILERMVPYHRETLLARLLDQQENPYAKAVALVGA